MVIDGNQLLEHHDLEVRHPQQFLGPVNCLNRQNKIIM